MDQAPDRRRRYRDMATFRATLSITGAGPRPALLTVDGAGLSLASDDRPIGAWPLDEVDLDISSDEVVVGAAGDTLRLRLEETVRFAREVERLRKLHAGPRRSRPVAWCAAAAAVVAVLVVVAPWVVSAITVVGGGAAVIGGGLGLADPGIRSMLPRRVTPVGLIATGVLALAVGLWMDLFF